MEIKEMPLEEKYDRLLNDYLLTIAMWNAFSKELGAVDKSRDLYVKVQKNMLPSVLGVAFKVLKAITPGRAFKQVVDRSLYWAQTTHPLSEFEVTKVSDREVVIRTKNCVALKRMRGLVKKAGLDIDPKFICEEESKNFPELYKEFGVDITGWKLEENGCVYTAKLK